MFEPGTILRHYKGGRYLVLTTGRDSEDKKAEVVYQSLDHTDEEPWVRPEVMFSDQVAGPMFEPLGQRFVVEADVPVETKSMSVRELAERIHTFQIVKAKERALQYAAILFAKVKGQVNGR